MNPARARIENGAFVATLAFARGDRATDWTPPEQQGAKCAAAGVDDRRTGGEVQLFSEKMCLTLCTGSANTSPCKQRSRFRFCFWLRLQSPPKYKQCGTLAAMTISGT